MTRFTIALAVLAAVGAVREPPLPVDVRTQKPADTLPSAQPLRIDVVAVDRNGNPVTDLKQEELEVWIGIYRVPIGTFTTVTSASEHEGRLVVLLLDDLTLDPAMALRVREVARRFVNRMVPGDRMAIAALNGDFMEMTGDQTRLRRTIDRYSGHSGGVMRLDEIGAHVLKTLASLSRQLVEATGRKIIVGIGAGWLFDTPIPPPTVGRDLRPEWTAALRAMAAAKANLYVIDPGGLGQSPFVNPSSGFARETGGHAFVNTNDFNGAVDQVMREASSYYVIGVADPPVGRNADLRELDVRVLRRGVTIRARRWIPGGN